MALVELVLPFGGRASALELVLLLEEEASALVGDGDRCWLMQWGSLS
jgi:hypothetical protein